MIVFSTLLKLLPFVGLSFGFPSKTLSHKFPGARTGIKNPSALQDLEKNITAYIVPANYGSASFNQVRALYPGAVGIVGNEGTIVSHFSSGYALQYADANGTELPKRSWVPLAKDSIFDMASLTKMFTTILALQQLEKGTIALNGTVASYLPGFEAGGKENVTVEMLLTHTAGFDADPDPGLWNGYATLEERRQAILTTAVIHTPGIVYLYSDLSFMSIQLLLEHITSTPLDELLKQGLTGPLKMTSTFYNRGNVEYAADELIASKIVATEYQIEVLGSVEPQRRQPVWGTVHDENAWGVDGVSGHAGLYSNAEDVAVFCQMILNNGTYGGTRVLKGETVDLIFTNFNTAFPGNAHGLGFELDQNYWSGPMHSLQTAGHTGYTGTSLAIDRPQEAELPLMDTPKILDDDARDLYDEQSIDVSSDYCDEDTSIWEVQSGQ
ncbi:hypothetical protein NP233_g7361 [Leucocoprinus birnbaumii]|uniref:Beta-lactamase-related domain-containing protein n=1 Tax=Leucocoprinus birnbaumii TaxID=56174 RepID=A0AAD5YUP1_9AGAR|nr:hypothetical protein NP233_g7361 [Leucocoprinus birnbaumii]